MQKKMGYILIAGVVALVVWGVVAMLKPKKELSVEAEPVEGVDSNAEGLAFEEYVVQLFNNKFFTVKEMREEKQADGVFLEMNFKLEAARIDANFAVECKWRKDFYKNGVRWASDEQIERYNEFSRERDLPVFVVIGVGGEPNDPKEMFVVPLEQLQKPFVRTRELKPYRRKNADAGFYWEAEEGVLR